jgi:hypothetical protein
MTLIRSHAGTGCRTLSKCRDRSAKPSSGGSSEGSTWTSMTQGNNLVLRGRIRETCECVGAGFGRDVARVPSASLDVGPSLPVRGCGLIGRYGLLVRGAHREPEQYRCRRAYGEAGNSERGGSRERRKGDALSVRRQAVSPMTTDRISRDVSTPLRGFRHHRCVRCRHRRSDGVLPALGQRNVHLPIDGRRRREPEVPRTIVPSDRTGSRVGWSVCAHKGDARLLGKHLSSPNWPALARIVHPDRACASSHNLRR